MNSNGKAKAFPKNAKFLLALHSSTDTFGLGLIQIDESGTIFKNLIIDVKHDLSNYLFNFVEELLPSILWNKIIRLSVATGPGGYTGTRITVTFARILAQQLNCDVDGISSFHLMAHRVPNQFISKQREETFWITQALKRRGIVAGQYKIINQKAQSIQIKELQPPHLIPVDSNVSPAFEISENIEMDINRLLSISFNLYKEEKKCSWKDVVPIYPTSPIKNFT